MPDEDRLSKADVLHAAILSGAVLVFLLFTAAIASPNFVKSRGGSPRHKSCVANLKQLDMAKEKYSAEHHLRAGAVLPDGCLWAKDGFIRSEPECPSGGTYSLGAVDEAPACSVGGKHSLD